MNNVFKNSKGNTVRFTKFFKPVVYSRKVVDNTTIVIVKLQYGYEPEHIFDYSEIKAIEKERFVGVTKLKGDDTFDKQTGLDVAEHKAMAKAFNYINKLFINKAKTYQKYAESCLDLAKIASSRNLKQVDCFKKKGEIK